MEELEASELSEELLFELLEELSADEVLELCETFVASSFNESTNEPSLHDFPEDLSSSGPDSCGWKVSSCVECSDGAALFLELSVDELELPLAEDLAEELIELVDGGFL